MAFELFKRSEFPARIIRLEKPAVYVDKKNILEFNKSAQEECGFSSGKYVRLFYDRNEKLVGVERSNNKDKDAIKIQVKGNMTISAFAYKYKLNIKEYSGKYLLHEHGALWVFDLKKRLEGRKIRKNER